MSHPRDRSDARSTGPHALSWRPAPLARRLTTLGGLAAVAAALAGNPTLLAVAAPALVALAVWLRGPRPAELTLHAGIDPARTFEDAPVALRTRAGVMTSTAGGYELSLRPTQQVSVDGDPVGVTLHGDADMTWQLRPLLWGWWQSAQVEARVLSPHRTWVAETRLAGPELTVFPPVTAVRDVPAPSQLMARLGPHVSRAAGAGIEFAGLRDYQPGDPVRRVNWVRSSRADVLLVNEHAQERMADVVVMIDSIREVGPPGASTVDESVRGAVGVVQAYLAHADRVGVVAFGSSLRWLTPTTGTRHFYRVVEVLLEARQARTYVDPSIDRLPAAVLPSGALVVCFSPLLDDVALEAIRDLRERAHPVVVVDVLTADRQPLRGPVDELAMRLWRLERDAIVTSLHRIGVSMVSYAEVSGGGLDWLRTTRSPAPGGPTGRRR
ncbi:MAG: DUF58 domain-containing protein [Actinomycetota bacterium]|nr:DUF58 domain-containing protein [Actinomycetota bacterium]